MRHCQDCDFWTDANGPNPKPPDRSLIPALYDCRAKAPIVNKETGRGFWPRTFHNDGCGDFQPYVEKPKALSLEHHPEQFGAHVGTD